ncbi:MAG: PLP-dependent aminotransferase family protein, partial [Oscillospiraceae bacterium]|nr:PLP-dependent aminotransferase family protein [Oscillospiraceae bacterium]
MNYQIDRETAVPAYIQLYRHLVRDIVAGVYPPGSKLPSKRVTAEETGVSVITVQHALDLLAEEGYAESRERSGCFVSYRQAGDVRVPGSAGPAPAPREPEAHMAGEFPYSVLARTMRKVLLDQGDRILVKSPNRGCAELREEISRYLIRSRGIEVPSDRIVVGSGAEYLYGLIAQLFGRDRVFALEDPSYSKIRKVYASFGVKCELLRLGPEGIPTEALERSEAGLLHVTPFNSYPSGVTAGASKKHEYIR